MIYLKLGKTLQYYWCLRGLEDVEDAGAGTQALAVYLEGLQILGK